MRLTLRIATAFLFVSTSLAADRLLPDSEYDPAVPTLKAVVGQDFGETILSHAQIERYLKALDESSDRVRLHAGGMTANGRQLYYMTVSDPATVAHEDEISAVNRGVYQAGGAFPSGHPVTVALYAAVHGDEISSVEALIALAYHLAASGSEETRKILRETMVLIDPLQNPDGRERFLAYSEWMRTAQPVADQNAAEHAEFWPGGRGNAYFFDMNRDWVMMTQPESRARVLRNLVWLPQVQADLHEMGGNSTYFFPPPNQPLNANIPPEIWKLLDIFGRANAAAFDEKGYAYYTREVYDEFFPGYGSSLPIYHGSVGMTYEQASTGGLVFRKSSGETLTYLDAIARHFTAALATCRASAANRDEILRSYGAIHTRAMTPPGTSELQGYVLPSQSNLDQLLVLLRDHGISIKQLRQPLSGKGALPIGFPAETAPAEFPAGSLVLPLQQPARSLLKALMEPRPVLESDFVAAEKERMEHRLPSEIYDITAWSLPYCYGISAFTTTASLPVMDDWKGPSTGAIRETQTSTPYAYLIDYAQNRAAAVAFAMVNEGFKVEVAEKAFTADGRQYSRGSYIMRVAANRERALKPELLRERLSALAQAHSITVDATASGYTEDSIDLGSEYVRTLRAPRIAVLMDEPISAPSYGAVRWLLETQYGIPFTPIKVDNLAYCDLRPYRTIIVPNGRGTDLARLLREDGVSRLKRWTESGGTLVVLGRSIEIVLKESFGVSDGKIVGSFKKDSTEPAPEKKAGEEKPEIEKDKEYEPPNSISGAFYRVELDQLDWLTSGYGAAIPVLVNGDLLFDWPASADRCVARFAKNGKLGGFSWEIDDRRLADMAYLVRAQLEDGQVIMFAYDPAFRGYLRGLDRLFLNAVANGASYTFGLDYGEAAGR